MMTNIKDIHEVESYTNKIIQFGEGNFLRCFIDWKIDILNEKTDFDGGIIIIRPIDTDFPPSLNTQNCLYTTVLRGINESKKVVKEYRVIKSVNKEIEIYKEYDTFLKLAEEESLKYIFSNTTEAGIAFNELDKFDDTPPGSFPAKLTRFLYERYRIFKGDTSKGFYIIPCELIDYNGEILKEIIFKYIDLWNLENGFKLWLEQSNTFCSTLVDRIVTGYPKDEIKTIETEIGYRDGFITTGEYFNLFVIQGPKELEEEFKLNEVNLNIKIVDDIKPYKTRKVGILNGAHTTMVPVGFLYGFDYVKECVEDDTVYAFIHDALFKEIIPVLDMDEEELVSFAEAVLYRFKNPYIKHQLLSISLNSMTKFRTRVLPQILNYNKKFGKLPSRLVFALAALIRFYKGERGGVCIELKDDADILELYRGLWKDYKDQKKSIADIVETVLGYEKNWHQNLNLVEGLKEKVTEYLTKIESNDFKSVLMELE